MSVVATKMPADQDANERFSLSRWSRRKLGAAREANAPPREPVAPPAAPAPAVRDAPPAAVAAAPAPVPAATETALPPVVSLTFESDFSAFMQPKVDESIKRAALKKLFSDPRFNVMDGLDVYVDDYSLPDPLPEGMLEKLVVNFNPIVDHLAPTAAAPAPTEEPIAADAATAAPASPVAAVPTIAITPTVAAAHAAVRDADAPIAPDAAKS